MYSSKTQIQYLVSTSLVILYSDSFEPLVHWKRGLLWVKMSTEWKWSIFRSFFPISPNISQYLMALPGPFSGLFSALKWTKNNFSKFFQKFHVCLNPKNSGFVYSPCLASFFIRIFISFGTSCLYLTSELWWIIWMSHEGTFWVSFQVSSSSLFYSPQWYAVLTDFEIVFFSTQKSRASIFFKLNECVSSNFG